LLLLSLLAVIVGCVFMYLEVQDYGFAKADWNAVATQCDTIIKDRPDYAEAYYIRGVAYAQMGEETKAAQDFAKAKELGYEEK